MHISQDGQVQELEVRLQNMEADLKTAERRADTLQDALKRQEEEFGSGEEEEDSLSRSLDDLSSSGGSYQIGELTGSMEDLSDGGSDYRLSSHLKDLGGGRSTTPRVEDLASPTRRNRFNPDNDKKTYSRRKRTNIDDEDDLLLSRRTARTVPLSDEEEEEDKKAKKSSYLSKLSDSEDDIGTTTRRRNRLGLDEEEEEGLPRRRYNVTQLSDDEDDIPSLKRGRGRLADEDDHLSPPTRGRGFSPATNKEAGSHRRKKYLLSDEEEDKPTKRSVSPGDRHDKSSSVTRVNGDEEGPTLSNGRKTSAPSLAGEKPGDEGGKAKDRRESIKNLVSKEQEQLYSVAQNRRRRRRTGDAKSTRQTAAHNNGPAS